MNQPDRCMNCHADLNGERYCAKCGQDHRYRRLNLTILLKDALVEFFEIEGPWMTTLQGLFPESGTISRNYVQGQRRRYVNPTKLLITVFVLFFVVWEIARSWADFGTSARNAQYITMSFVILYCPVIALLLRACYFEIDPEIADVLVFVLYLASATLMPIFLFAPIGVLLGRWAPIDLLDPFIFFILFYLLILTPLYWSISIQKFFASSWWRSILASYGLGGLGFIGWMSFYILLPQ